LNLAVAVGRFGVVTVCVKAPTISTPLKAPVKA
jgi:hypothetical protein